MRFDHFAVDVQSQDGFYPQPASPTLTVGIGSVAQAGHAVPHHTQLEPVRAIRKGFRAPTATQVNGYFENAAEAVVIVPNPDLKPEKSRSIEFGARGRFDNPEPGRGGVQQSF